MQNEHKLIANQGQCPKCHRNCEKIGERLKDIGGTIWILFGCDTCDIEFQEQYAYQTTEYPKD